MPKGDSGRKKGHRRPDTVSRASSPAETQATTRAGSRRGNRLEGGGSRWPSRWVPAAFFLSGVSALIYELLWFRMLGHIFGSTATAAATLLAAYLFGLGLGAWIFGRLSDRAGRLALLYVAIEVGIGLYGLASHALLQRSAVLYAAAHSWAAESAGRLLISRFAISFLLIVIPTTLMGGTFPLMVHLLKTRATDAGHAAARAYAVNTAGAALGALALPILILPQLGIALSLVAAAMSNLAAALCAFLYARGAGLLSGRLRSGTAPASRAVNPPPRPAPSPPDEPASMPTAIPVTGPTSAPTSTPPAPTDPLPAPLLAGFFLSSFAALSLETVWARHFGIFFGTQTTTFAFILCAYLIGLFLGGSLYGRLTARGHTPLRLLRAGFLLSAVSVGVTIPFLDHLPVPQILLMSAIGVSNSAFVSTTGLQTLCVVLPPALGFGLAFPAMVACLAARGRGTGSSVALTYAVNTMGTTLGSIGAGFWLIPAVGSQRTFEVSVLLLAAALALIALADQGSRTACGARGRLVAYGLPALFLLLPALPRWDWRFAHGMYSKDPVSFVRNFKSGELQEALATYRVPFLDEGTEATVSVLAFGDKGRQSLFINGKPDASNIPDDMVTQRLIGLIPALFSPGLHDVLVIGLGSGCTVGTLKRFPLTHLDVAEISPGVARAAREHFADINDRFLDDPRVKLRLDDGRNFLHFRPADSYDLIVSEPSNPWTAGVSALFTDEFFAEAREKLRDGGVLCQWFHYYNMSLDHIRLLIRTFARHFPQSAVFLVQGDRPTGDLILVGSKGPLRLIRPPEDPELPNGVRAAFAEVKNPTLERLLSGLAVGPEEVGAFAGQGVINTDDRPILEFEAPADRFTSTFVSNYRALLGVKDRILLPVGFGLDEQTAETALAAAGFALMRGRPEGKEVRRGALVLNGRESDGASRARWSVLGSEFATGDSRVGLYHLTRLPRDEAEIRAIAECLIGSTSSATGSVTVHGHAGLWIEGIRGSKRLVACAWICAESGRALFLTREVPAGSSGTAEELARDLASRFPCAHRQ